MQLFACVCMTTHDEHGASIGSEGRSSIKPTTRACGPSHDGWMLVVAPHPLRMHMHMSAAGAE